MAVVYIALAVLGAWVVWDVARWLIRRSRAGWRVEPHLFPQKFEARQEHACPSQSRHESSPEALKKSGRLTHSESVSKL